MKTVFVTDIKERNPVDTLFLVRGKTLAMAKNGKPYMTLKLADKSGEIEARVWDRVDEFDRLFAQDDFIRVQGKGNVYLGKMQLVVQNISPVQEEDVDLADFLPVAPRPVAEMLDELRQKCHGVQNPHLRALMFLFLDDTAFMADFSRAPAGKTMHHAYLGGLLEHSLSLSNLVDDICGHYPQLNRDLLVCAALLHDAGKVEELRYRRSFDYTDAGKLLGHIVLGVELVDARLRQLPDFPPMLAIELKHLLLSHHGQYDYGSPKRPKTLEAVVLNLIDEIDSKVNGLDAFIERETEAGSNWSRYHRMYDRYFFRNSETPQEESRTASQIPQPSSSPEPNKEKPREKKERFGNSLGDKLGNLDLFS